jgi:hypothetical protein
VGIVRVSGEVLQILEGAPVLDERRLPYDYDPGGPRTDPGAFPGGLRRRGDGPLPPGVYGYRLNLDEYFIVFRGRFCYLLELKNLR